MIDYIKYLVEMKLVRIACALVALLFLAIFALLKSSGVVETGTTTGVIGVALYIIVTIPIAIRIGRYVRGH